MYNEVKVPVMAHRIKYMCSECGVGEMEFNGKTYMSAPPLYEHKCNKCENVQKFHQQYPHIDFEENTECELDESSYSYLKIAEILDKYLPPDGVGTEREKLRMNLYRELLDIL